MVEQSTVNRLVAGSIPARGAEQFISPMHTPGPATRPAFAFDKFLYHSLNMILPCLYFLNRDNPTNPLIASKWSNILPCIECVFRRSQLISQICWQRMHHTTRNFFFEHGIIIPNTVDYEVFYFTSVNDKIK